MKLFFFSFQSAETTTPVKSPKLWYYWKQKGSRLRSKKIDSFAMCVAIAKTLTTQYELMIYFKVSQSKDKTDDIVVWYTRLSIIDTLLGTHHIYSHGIALSRSEKYLCPCNKSARMSLLTLRVSLPLGWPARNAQSNFCSYYMDLKIFLTGLIWIRVNVVSPLY